MLMINQSFIQLIENYKKNNKDVDLVRKYLLSNVYELDNLNEYIAYFEKSASSINDSLGIAIAKMAYFWDLYMTDLLINITKKHLKFISQCQIMKIFLDI